VLLLLAGCDSRQYWTTEVLTLDCGGSTLRFEERAERVRFAGASFYTQHLLRDGVELDHFPKPTPVYTRLYAPEDAFRVFPGAAARPGQEEAWDVFAPAEAYEALASCLERGREAVDAAFVKPRREEKGMEAYKRSRMPKLASIVRRRYEPSGLCAKTGKLVFDCGQAYLRLAPPARVELCLAAPANDIEAGGDVVGVISANGSKVQWKAAHGKIKRELAGADWQRYYRSCRDAEGRSPLDLFK
jgi:hypothetical protein